MNLTSKHASPGGHKDRKGVGLFSYEQERYTTAFQYFAQIVIGAVFATVGGLLVFQAMTMRIDDVRTSGDWISGIIMILTGVFVAHAGAIYYTRRMKKRLLGSRGRSTSDAGHRD